MLRLGNESRMRTRYLALRPLHQSSFYLRHALLRMRYTMPLVLEHCRFERVKRLVSGSR